jgi:hypothetical protein
MNLEFSHVEAAVILAGGLASEFTMEELDACIFPQVLALSRPIVTLLGITLQVLAKPQATLSLNLEPLYCTMHSTEDSDIGL